MQRYNFADWLKENYIIDYYKIGVADDPDEPIRTAEVGSYTDQDQLDTIRQTYQMQSKHVYAKPATEQEFRDYSDGKEVPYADDPITAQELDKKSSPDDGLSLI